MYELQFWDVDKLLKELNYLIAFTKKAEEHNRKYGRIKKDLDGKSKSS